MTRATKAGKTVKQFADEIRPLYEERAADAAAEYAGNETLQRESLRTLLADLLADAGVPTEMRLAVRRHITHPRPPKASASMKLADLLNASQGAV